ncbi:M61 family metallopeptidase [Robertkochia aurantiaca]|uniref:M61 family metallopeptidase n=1 Tax=Robertkochia aurantiaca TaxID=2873700 RepID=UPI001CD01162|nr:hypothetical protein [Robertkochia sp. 3YJGBD-33]
MQFLLKILFLFFAFLSSLNIQGQRPEDSQTDHYHLTFLDTQPRSIAVQATLNLSDSLLFMNRHDGKAARWPEHIHDVKVFDMQGHQLEVDRPDSLSWVLEEVPEGKQVKLEYTLLVDHEEEEWSGGIDGVAFGRDYGVMSSGRALFVMNGTDKEITLTADLPESWKLSVPWPSTENTEEGFYIADHETLTEAFLFAGTHEEVNLRRGPFTLKFVLGGKNVQAEKERYAHAAERILDYYVQLMGGIPNTGDAAERFTSMVMINEGESVDGEVIGDHISMLLNPTADPQNQLIGWFIFAHEFFHLWNGKSIRFEGTTSDWFKEGVSNYYTIKALYQTGFVDEEALKAVLNGLFYQRYVNDPGFGKKTPVEAAAWDTKDDHWGLIYGGGLFAGICMDMEIRHQSANEKCLDMLMRDLYREYAGSRDLVTNDVIIERTKDLGFTGFDEFFNGYLNGTAHVPLLRYLSHAGLDVSTENQALILSLTQQITPLQEAIWNGFLGNHSCVNTERPE